MKSWEKDFDLYFRYQKHQIVEWNKFEDAIKSFVSEIIKKERRKAFKQGYESCREDEASNKLLSSPSGHYLILSNREI